MISRPQSARLNRFCRDVRSSLFPLVTAIFLGGVLAGPMPTPGLAQQMQPSVAAQPSTGAPGQAITLSGAGWTPSPSPSSPGPATVARSPSPSFTTLRVFLHDRARLDDPEAVVGVSRQVFVEGQRVATAALNALAQRTTPEEASRGLFSQVAEMLRGSSSCGGATFAVSVDPGGLLTARLCRATESGGVLADARFMTEVRATARQFPTVREVRILTQGGHCFGDLSGQDRCLSSR